MATAAGFSAGQVVAVEIIGGHKFAIALQALAHKISDGGTLKVGFLEGATYAAGDNSAFLKAVGSSATPTPTKVLPVAQVAFWNEFGTKRAKARPFFRNTISDKAENWGAGLAKLVVATNYDGKKSLSLLGVQMVNDIKETINKWPADNRPLTVKIKGFDKGLIQSKTMRDAVAFKVET